MSPRITVASTLLIFSICSTKASAFVVDLHCTNRFGSHKQQNVSCRSVADGKDDGGSEQKLQKAMLTFGATTNVTSDPLPKETKPEDVAAFLEDPHTKRSLLSAGGIRAVEEVSMTPELENLWQGACKEDYGDDMLPSEGDSILVTDTSTQFPGLKMVNKVYNGAKVATNDETGIPKYRFILVGEKRSVSGLPPLVWLFNKMTGGEKRTDSIMKASGVAKSEITAIEDGNGSLVFNFVAQITIKVRFPQTLLKLLPTSKEKTEESGSAALRKTIERDVERGVKGTRDAFLKYQSSLS